MDNYQKYLASLATLTLLRLLVKDIIDLITHNNTKKKSGKKKSVKTSRKGSNTK